MSYQDHINVTVVGPEGEAPLIIGKNESGVMGPHLSLSGLNYSEYDFPDTPEFSSASQYDGHSSGGYSTPMTPYTNPLSSDESVFDPSAPFGMGPFSPTGLSPSLVACSLAEITSEDDILSGHLRTLNDPSSPYQHVQDIPFFSVSNPRANLQQLIIPGGDEALPLEDVIDINSAVSDPYQSPSSHLASPFNALALNSPLPPTPHGQDTSGMLLAMPQRTHHRGLSESGTAWSSTPSTHPSPSPSYYSPNFTPTDYQSSSSLLSPPSDLEYTCAFGPSEATLQRRHTGTGNSSTRGRSHSRHGPPSASSSRRSSPYPSPRISCSPSDTLSPHMLSPDLLTVPTNNNNNNNNNIAFGSGGMLGGSTISRRHSFSAGVNPLRQTGHIFMQQQQQQLQQLQHMQHDGSLSAEAFMPYPSEPVTTLVRADTTPARKVASTAGIRASEARRTKEAKFGCEQCGQTFTTNHNLKNHRNVHLGVKEHECKSCLKNFTTQSVLARHVKKCKIALARQLQGDSSSNES